MTSLLGVVEPVKQTQSILWSILMWLLRLRSLQSTTAAPLRSEEELLSSPTIRTMSENGAIVKEEQREMLEGLGEQILSLVTDHRKLPSTVWGDWLAVPFERACADGDDRLASVLLKAGAKGFGLQHAALAGHRRVILKLLQLGASPNSTDASGDTALHVAAQAGHGPIVETLLSEGANKDLVDGLGRSPLHLATLAGSVTCVMALLAAGVNLALRFPLGVYNVSALDAAARYGHVHVLRTLIKRGAMETVQPMKRTPLHFAAEWNEVAAIQLLVGEGVNINVKDAEGYTPLLLATLENNAPAVQALCALGADVSLRVKTNFCFETDDFAALDLAAYYGWTDIMNVLIKHGSDVNALSSKGYSALHKAAEGNEVGAVDVLVEAGAAIHGTAGFDSPLHMAVEGKAIQAIHALVRHGANPEWTEGLRETPLLRAVMLRHSGSVNALLAAGASPNVSGSDKTLLFASLDGSGLDYGGPDIVQDLLAHGAQVDALSRLGETALHAAAAWTEDYIVDILVEAGATVCTPCGEEQTPLHAAAAYLNPGTAMALLGHGVPVNAQDRQGNTALHYAALGSERPEDGLEMVNLLLIEGADETIVNKRGKTPASNLPLAPTGHRASDVFCEQVRELLLRAPADRADRTWRRRGMVFLCHAFPEKAEMETGSRTPKLPRAAESGGTAAGTIGEGRIDANFRGMVANLFGLRDGTEEIFRQIITLL